MFIIPPENQCPFPDWQPEPREPRNPILAAERNSSRSSQLLPKMLARLPKVALANNRVAAAGAVRQAGRTASVRILQGTQVE